MTAAPRPLDPQVLLEAATSAHRERDIDGRIKPSPAWADLTPDQRFTLFDRQLLARLIEQSTHPQHLSSTARLVADRIAHLPQL